MSFGDELNLTLSNANIKYCKLFSNSTRFLDGIPKQLCELRVYNLPMKCWTLKFDNVLSYTARIFDSLGLVAKTVMLCKILLQRLLFHKLSWDCNLLTNRLYLCESNLFGFPRFESIKLSRIISSPFEFIGCIIKHI